MSAASSQVIEVSNALQVPALVTIIANSTTPAMKVVSKALPKGVKVRFNAASAAAAAPAAGGKRAPAVYRQGALACAVAYGVLTPAPQESTACDEWCEFALTELNAGTGIAKSATGDASSLDALTDPLKALDRVLATRMFLADSAAPTLADAACFAGLCQAIPSVIAEAAKDGKGNTPLPTRFPCVARWARTLVQLPAFVAALPALESAKSQTKAPQGKSDGGKTNVFVGETGINLGKAGSFDKLTLPGAEMGKVVTRFPPEPSGYMHIGHAKASLMNNFYAQKYGGQLILRFDDTNPSKEKQDYVDSIEEDVRTLGFTNFKITYTSDSFDALEKYCEQLISSGLGYCDDTDGDTIRDQRGKGIESKCRNQTVEQNLALWAEMKKGSDEGRKFCVRAKIDMNHKNKVMRDPNLFRVVLDPPHHRTGSKHKVYALYDFACPIVDSLEGVTHALRSAEYISREELYYWVCDALKIRKPHMQTFSRMNFSYTLLSKRKLQWFVDEGHASGWDDPRFPTIKGLLRRGLEVAALRDFVLSMGASTAENMMEMSKLWAVNKKYLDPRVPRFTAITKDHACQVVLRNYAQVTGTADITYATKPKHNRQPELGNKVVSYGSTVLIESVDAQTIQADGDKEVTLMSWGNIKIVDIQVVDGLVEKIVADLHLEGNVRDTSKKLTWLVDSQCVGSAKDVAVDCELISYSELITKPKIEDDDNVEDIRNKNSMRVQQAYGDENFRLLKKGDKMQLERRGFYIVDKVERGFVSLIEIPDGSTSGKGASVLMAQTEGPRRTLGGKGKQTKGAHKTGPADE